MSHDVDAIFHEGVFQPLEPIILPEGTRVHLRVETDRADQALPTVAQLRSPRLAHPEQAADFQMRVSDAGL